MSDDPIKAKATYARRTVTYNVDTNTVRGLPGALVLRYSSTPKMGKKGMRYERRILVRTPDGRKWLGTFPATGQTVELRCATPEKGKA